jgi:hypothetical protein
MNNPQTPASNDPETTASQPTQLSMSPVHWVAVIIGAPLLGYVCFELANKPASFENSFMLRTILAIAAALLTWFISGILTVSAQGENRLRGSGGTLRWNIGAAQGLAVFLIILISPYFSVLITRGSK